jgi:alpha-beta hydrolase superfamily lysophospholipase
MRRRHATSAVRALALAAIALAATGCRQVQLAGPDRELGAITGSVGGSVAGSGIAWSAGPAATPAASGGARPLARPAPGDDEDAGPAPRVSIADDIRRAAPRACVLRSGTDWSPAVDGLHPGELIREHIVWQADSRRAIRESNARDRIDPVAAAAIRHHASIRTSRWRSRTVDPSPRGIIVRLHGLDEAPIDLRLDRQLLAAGWMIVQYDSIELGGIGFVRGPDGRTVRTVQSPASAGRLVDEIMAQVASAAERVVQTERQWIERETGDAHAPVVVVGTSLGGIFAPTVASLLDDRLSREGDGLDGLVLLAAGGDLGAISATSPAMDIGPDLIPPVELVSWRQLMQQAIAWSRLDPLVVAPSLRRVPALMLHGRFDEIVPARYGTQLWNALGRPDRYSYLAGHYGLLGLLTGESDAVMRWIERRVGPATAATPPSG